MPWTIESALDAPSVTEPKIIIGEYQFYVGKLQTPIVVKLYRYPGGKEIFFMLSHFIHTPSQSGPYQPSSPCDDDEAYALHRAVSMTIADWYDGAVKEGHEPRESWLIENKLFR